MSQARFTVLPRIHVTMDDGNVDDVQALNIDLVMFDRERARHRDWPSPVDGSAFYQTWVAWHAMVRTERIPRMTFNEFCEHALEVAPAEDEDEDQAEVDPTRTGPGPD